MSLGLKGRLGRGKEALEAGETKLVLIRTMRANFRSHLVMGVHFQSHTKSESQYIILVPNTIPL